MARRKLSPGTPPEVPPELGQPGKRNRRCKDCQRYQLAGKHPFLPVTDANSRLAVAPPTPLDVLEVGESPGKTERRVGNNFVGDSGTYLDGVEYKIGLRPAATVGRVNAVRCYADHKPTVQEIAACRPFLFQDILKYKPKVVVTLGKIALKSVANLSEVMKMQGRVIRTDTFTLVPVMHPAAVLRDNRHAKSFQEAMTVARRALAQEQDRPAFFAQLRERYEVITERQRLDEVLAEWRERHVVALDTEFVPLSNGLGYQLLGISVAWASRMGIFIPLDHPESPFADNPEIRAAIRDVVEAVPMIAHSADADYAALVKGLTADPRKVRFIFDTAVSSMALYGKQASHRLKARAYVDADTGGYDDELEAWQRQHEHTGPWSEIPLNILSSPYGAGDADTTYQCFLRDLERLPRRQQLDYVVRIATPAHRLNVLMRWRGMLVDWDEWGRRWAYWQQEKADTLACVLKIPAVAAFAQEHTKATRKKFSLRSGQQLQALFQLVGLPPPGRQTATGRPSFDQYALDEVAPSTPEQQILVDSIRHMADIEKTIGTYLDGVAAVMHSDGRVHPEFHQFTESGRRASKRPNVQNLPMKDPRRPTYDAAGGPGDPWNFRMLYTAGPGRIFVASDYGQLEMRLAACFSRDPQLVASCQADDPHQLTQQDLEIPRRQAKTVNFACIYGCGPSRLQREMRKSVGIEWDLQKCQTVIDRYGQLYPVLIEYIAECHRTVEEKLYVTTPLGHVRWFPHVRSKDEAVAERARREAWNHQCQSTGHDLLTFALDRVQSLIWEAGVDWHVVNDTHDGAILDVPVGQEELAGEALRWAMATVAPTILGDFLTVPLPVEISTGTHFGNVTKL